MEVHTSDLVSPFLFLTAHRIRSADGKAVLRWCGVSEPAHPATAKEVCFIVAPYDLYRKYHFTQMYIKKHGMRNISTHTPKHLLYASHLHTSSMPHTHTPPLCLTPTHLLYASHLHTSSMPHTSHCTPTH